VRIVDRGIGSGSESDRALREANVVVKLKRYLGNGNTLEVHDTQNEKTNCQLDEIKVEHRHWYDTLAEAKRDKAYDNCAWCVGGSTR
jgi:hypothetical protein